jgi:proteasomal ATPase-associated factor 1
VPFTKFAMPIKEWSDPERSNSVKVRYISCPEFLWMTKTWAQPHSITAFDVSPDGAHFASGYHDGTVHILPTADASTTAALLQKAKPHLSTVTALRFFPSSRVLLTGGNDFSLSILPADPMTSERAGAANGRPTVIQPVRALKGHTRAVTSLVIAGVGRNVLSGAKDGSVRLWDVSAGQQIRAFFTSGFAPVLAIASGERALSGFSVLHDPDGNSSPTLGSEQGNANAAPSATQPPAVDGEVGTDGQIIFAALSSGAVEAFDVRTGQSLWYSGEKLEPATSSVAYSPGHNLVAAGSAKGVVRVWDTRALDSPLVQFTRGSASVDNLAFIDLPESTSVVDGDTTEGVGRVGLVVAGEDGLPFVARIAPVGLSVHVELVGPDCETLGGIAIRGSGVWGSGSEIWTSAGDGVVRRY